MMAAVVSAAAPMDAAMMRALAGVEGPCVTARIPAFHPGAGERAPKTALRALLQAAGPEVDAKLLEPLWKACGEPEMEHGGRGMALYSFPGGMVRVEAPVDGYGLVAAGYPYLKPFVTAAFAPDDFAVLALSVKKLRLFEYKRGECREAPLPKGVPESLEAAGMFDRPDHMLHGRSTAGGSAGDMGGVRFGTSADREARPEHLKHFFLMAHRGLKHVLGGRHLLLMGVSTETAAYRVVCEAKYLPDVAGNADFLTAAEVAEKAREAALAWRREQGRRVLERFREMPGRERTLNGVEAVFEAAKAGRVHQLCFREGTEWMSRLKGPKAEDWINAAIVETLRHRGEVFEVAAEELPAEAPLAAVLRY